MHVRNRKIYALMVFLTIGAGLFSRSSLIPAIVYPYLGDLLYATMAFYIFGFLMPAASSRKTAFCAFLFCFAIEMSQLIDMEWINCLRTYRLGALVLGRGFLWSDLAAYCCGCGLGFVSEKAASKFRPAA